MQKVPVKILREGAALPTYGTASSAGADLRACLDAPVVLAPGETRLIPIGIAMEIPEGYVGLVFARSGLASRRDLAPANKVGVVDSDYRGEFFVPMRNHGAQPQTGDDKLARDEDDAGRHVQPHCPVHPHTLSHGAVL